MNVTFSIVYLNSEKKDLYKYRGYTNHEADEK